MLVIIRTKVCSYDGKILNLPRCDPKYGQSATNCHTPLAKRFQYGFMELIGRAIFLSSDDEILI